MSTGTLYS